jgi:hypothetical protein
MGRLVCQCSTEKNEIHASRDRAALYIPETGDLGYLLYRLQKIHYLSTHSLPVFIVGEHHDYFCLKKPPHPNF